jgi:GDP-L-fucose synthase
MKYLNRKIYIAGHKGMVGSAISQQLKESGASNIITATSKELNLTNQKKTEDFFSKERPEIVIICAAKVGGILANNKYRGQFIYNNLQIATNIIHASHLSAVKKLIFLGSSCIYPKEAKQPIKEEYLLSGHLEPTNEPYAIAKIAGVKMCESYYREYNNNFYSIMPCNLFGENDNYNLKTSHVLPALIRKFHEAKINKSPSVEIWGSGKPLREFLYTRDLARGVELCINNVEAKDIYEQDISHINIGSKDEVSIGELAKIIKKITNFKGKIEFNKNKPDGTMRKKMNNSRIESLGFKQNFSFEESIKICYNQAKTQW